MPGEGESDETRRRESHQKVRITWDAVPLRNRSSGRRWASEPSKRKRGLAVRRRGRESKASTQQGWPPNTKRGTTSSFELAEAGKTLRPR